METIITRPNGKQETIKIQRLLGYDGYRSFVKESLKIPYQGASLKQEFIMIDVSLSGKLTHSKILVFYHQQGPTVAIPMKGPIESSSKFQKTLTSKKLTPHETNFFRYLKKTLAFPISFRRRKMDKSLFRA